MNDWWIFFSSWHRGCEDGRVAGDRVIEGNFNSEKMKNKTIRQWKYCGNDRSIISWLNRVSLIFQCYMYCLWKQFGMVDSKKELDLKGMLTFFQRIPAYREEVRRAVSHCKVIARTSGTNSFLFFFIYILHFSATKRIHWFLDKRTFQWNKSLDKNLQSENFERFFVSVSGDNCQYAYTFNRCYADLSPNVRFSRSFALSNSKLFSFLPIVYCINSNFYFTDLLSLLKPIRIKKKMKK